MALFIALLSGLFFFLQSGGTKYLGLPKIKDVWTALGAISVGLFAFLFAGLPWYFVALITGLWATVMTLARGPAFHDWRQTVSLDDDNDFILNGLAKLFGKRHGDVMGAGMWLAYSLVRWWLPVGAVGYAVAGVYGITAGVTITAGYLLAKKFAPKAMAYEGSTGSEHLGAGLAGLLPLAYLILVM